MPTVRVPHFRSLRGYSCAHPIDDRDWMTMDTMTLTPLRFAEFDPTAAARRSA